MARSIYIEEITETYDELLARADLNVVDLGYLHSISNPKRQLEWLKSRVMALDHIGKRIFRMDNGAPTVDDGYISISHCDGNVALLYSTDAKCGIDIEIASRSVSRIVRKFATKAEIEIASSLLPENPELLVWCSKEALFKRAGIEGVEFIRDLQIIGALKKESRIIEAKYDGANKDISVIGQTASCRANHDTSIGGQTTSSGANHDTSIGGQTTSSGANHDTSIGSQTTSCGANHDTSVGDQTASCGANYDTSVVGQTASQGSFQAISFDEQVVVYFKTYRGLLVAYC